MRAWLIDFLSSPTGLVVVAVAAVALATILTALFCRALLAGSSGGTGRPTIALAGLLLGAVVVVPLLFTIASADVFVLPKLTALRVALIAGLLLLGLSATRRVGGISSPTSRATRVMDVALIAYAVLTALATVTSIDPGLSLVGQDEQYQGLLTTLLFIAFFYLARVSLKSQRGLSLLLVAAAAGGAVVAGYALLQQLHLDPIWTDLWKDRVFSTLGQAEWLGAYFVLCLALGGALLWRVRPIARLFVAVALGLTFTALLLTLSRGAYVGIVVAAAVLLVSLAPRARPSRNWLLAVPALGIVAAFVIVIPPMRSEAETVLSRATSTTDLSEGSIEGRLDMWKVATAISIDYPLLGTGPETYTLMFPEYRDSLLASRRDFWLAYEPESPHNVYLAVASGAGLPALGAYLALIGAVLFQLVRAMGRAPNRAARTTLAAMLAAIAGYLVADVFMTADITGSWMLWLVMGAAVGYAESLRGAAEPVPAPAAIETAAGPNADQPNRDA